jgi:DNA-binding transcriptional LysR family regulator
MKVTDMLDVRRLIMLRAVAAEGSIAAAARRLQYTRSAGPADLEC